MNYRLEIEIPGLPETTNEVLAMRPRAPIARASLTLTRCSTTRPDPDGLTSSFKHIIDGLVKSGVLADDRHENIGFPTYLWEQAPRGKGCIRIQLIEVNSTNEMEK